MKVKWTFIEVSLSDFKGFGSQGGKCATTHNAEQHHSLRIVLANLLLLVPVKKYVLSHFVPDNVVL